MKDLPWILSFIKYGSPCTMLILITALILFEEIKTENQIIDNQEILENHESSDERENESNGKELSDVDDYLKHQITDESKILLSITGLEFHISKPRNPTLDLNSPPPEHIIS